MSRKENNSNRSNNNCRGNNAKEGNRRNPSNRGKGRNNKPTPKVMDKPTVSDAINDVGMYFTDPVLLNQLTNFSYDQFLGVPVDFGKDDITNKDMSEQVSNICRYYVNPSAGWVDKANPLGAGINMAGFNTYLALSSSNAKTTDYAPQDVTTLLLAVGQLIAMLSWGARAYGLSNLSNARNRAYPRIAIAASGFDFEDMKSRMADYRIRYNLLVQEIDKIKVPNNVEYFRKCANMFAGVYTDQANSSLAQTYMFVPYSTWTFEEAYSEQGTGLKTKPLFTSFGTTITFGQYLDVMEEMTNKLLSSTTLHRIYSDIMRLSSKEGLVLYQFSKLGEDYVVVPSYNPELELYINNCNSIGAPVAASSRTSQDFTPDNDVIPDVNKNCVIYRPQFAPSVALSSNGMYVNFSHENPTVEEKVYATRLAMRTKGTIHENQYFTTQVALPDFYIVGCSFYTGASSTAEYSQTYWQMDINQFTAKQVFNLVALMSKFDWHPYVYAIDSTAENPLLGSFGDLQYYTLLDFEYIARMHDAAMIGLFTVR